jgi:hypothetical protein
VCVWLFDAIFSLKLHVIPLRIPTSNFTDDTMQTACWLKKMRLNLFEWTWWIKQSSRQNIGSVLWSWDIKLTLLVSWQVAKSTVVPLCLPVEAGLQASRYIDMRLLVDLVLGTSPAIDLEKVSPSSSQACCRFHADQNLGFWWVCMLSSNSLHIDARIPRRSEASHQI